jgi:hypothetical protein
MLNQPGYYLYNCQGYLFGPYHVVRPPHLPFQGMLPAPAMMQAMPGAAAAAANGCPYPYNGLPAGGAGAGHPGGVPGLWFHPAVRSPRDFFMIETDPSRQDFRYGYGRGLALPGAGDR